MLIGLLWLTAWMALGQEFRASVSVNSQKLMSTTQSFETTDTKIFDVMQQSLENFVNVRKWSNLELESQELIDCSIAIILTRRTSMSDFEAQITVQLRRPVYNATYTTGLFNYIESSDFQFSFNENQPLDFEPNTFQSNLTSVVAYYLYLFLGMYFDSFAPYGGEPFYEVATEIAQTAAASNYKGWSASDNRKARYWFVENNTNAATRVVRQANYTYHRLGLDLMTRNQQQARSNIIQALEMLQEVHNARPNTPAVTQFVDVKAEELFSIFTPAPEEEKRKVLAVVKQLTPTNTAKFKDWNLKP